MNASRFALVDLALGVVLLGLLPSGDVLTPGQREPGSTPAVSASSKGDLPAKRLEPHILAIERWKATRQRLLEGAGGAPDHVAAHAGDESLAATDAAAASRQREAASQRGDGRTEAQSSSCDEMDETTGQLRQAELRLLRLLASEGDRSDERAEPGQDTSQPSLLDELARLISWEKPADNRPDVSARGRPAPASIPGSIPRVRR